VRIVELRALNEAQLEQCAQLLVTSFAEHWPEAWPTIEDAREEVRSFFTVKDRFLSFAALDGEHVLGWIGGIKEYDGNVTELHPIAVDPAQRDKGIGKELVAQLESAARASGAYMIRVGTDDEDNMTSLSNVDLYDDLPEKIANVQNLRRHPMGFYFKLGYTIIGVVPEANGPGKPDIIMGKRL
jgi:aminoglycoside 6'-N-acetyltransferase I